MLSDLQVHTPFDKNHGYGDVGGPAPNKDFAEALIRAHHDLGVRVVAVTDHNTVEWWPALDEAGKKIGVFVFPGVEVNVNKCHLLALWERSTDGFNLARQFLGAIFGPGIDPIDDDRKPAPVPSGNVIDVAQKAVDYKGLVLAPHATMKRMGLFASNVCNVSSQVAQSGLVAGFDLLDNNRADVLANPRSEFGDHLPAWFSSGDVRSLEAVGKNACYLKVGDEPSLESLRQAFLMPTTRIRLRGELEGKWKKTKHVAFLRDPGPTNARIESLRIDGGFHDGLRLSFGPGLNAVIGGKGTGKSALVEIIRFALCPDSPPSNTSNRERNFPNNAEVRVGFVDDQGEHYSVEKAGSSDQARLLRGDEVLDVDLTRRIRVQVFGQRQLADLPSNAEELRRFVVSRQAAKVRAAETKRDRALARARGIAEEIDGLDAEVDKNTSWAEELKDVSDRLKRITTPEATKQIQESEKLEEADSMVQGLMAWPAEILEAVTAVEEVSEPPSLPEDVELPSGLKQARRSASSQVKKGVDAVRVATEHAAEELDKLGDQWDQVAAEKREEVKRLLADVGLANAAELSQLQREKTRLEKDLGSSSKKLTTRSELIPQRQSATEELDQARREISRLIEAAVRELNDETGPRVRLVHEGLADDGPLLEFLSDRILGRRITAAQAARVSELDGRRLAAAALAGETELKQLGLTQTVADSLGAADKSVLRELEEVERPDKIRIEVDVAEDGESRWTDVTEASPGQAATALLELALIASDEPLVIDQPEDDLDNRFIYDEVVQKIAEVANRRQVIVATHNANIPVLGDAELVVAFEASSERGRTLANGGLDDPAVAQTARKILEGGAEAFEARAQRYAHGSPMPRG